LQSPGYATSPGVNTIDEGSGVIAPDVFGTTEQRLKKG
jgi:hypothetical protein